MTGHSLSASGLSAGYGDSLIIEGLDLIVPRGKITVIVGANAPVRSCLTADRSIACLPGNWLSGWVSCRNRR